MHTDFASKWFDTSMFGFSLGTRILIWVIIIAIIGGTITVNKIKKSD